MTKLELQSPITYYGGKKLMLRHILPIIPPHTTYVEPFAGGLAVYFSKPPSSAEFVNDLNGFVINFYKQLKENFESLKVRVDSTLHSRRANLDAFVMYENPHLFTDLDKAWAFWVLCNQGVSGQISKSWGSSNGNNKQAITLTSKRSRFTDALQKRLENTQIDCIDAVELIKLKDSDDTFFYIDPPYVGSDMGHYKGYTQAHFETLLNALKTIKGKFLLSSYGNRYLDECVQSNDWHVKTFDMPTMASSTKKRKIEVLTANYPI